MTEGEDSLNKVLNRAKELGYRFICEIIPKTHYAVVLYPNGLMKVSQKKYYRHTNRVLYPFQEIQAHKFLVLKLRKRDLKKPKKIIRVCPQSGEKREYGSITEAAEELDMYSKNEYNHIYSCLSGVRPTAYGYNWRYKKGFGRAKTSTNFKKHF